MNSNKKGGISKSFTTLYVCLIFVIGTVSFLLIAIPILHGAFFFTFDQARDAVWVKNQIDFLKLSLIGPWGSLNGVFFGPLWFWLLAIPYFFSGGDPVALTLFNAVIVYATLLISSVFIKKFSPSTAYFFLILGFCSFEIDNIAATAFSQHLLPLFTFFLIYTLTRFSQTNKVIYIYLAIISSTAMFHAEPPLFLFSLPMIVFSISRSAKKRRFLNLKTVFIAFIFFIIPFIPTILFEIRHDFLQLKAVFGYAKGQNQSLGDILPFWQRLIDRPYKFFYVFQKTIINQSFLAFLIFFLTIFINAKMLLNQFLKKIWKICCTYLELLLAIFILYPPELKFFYLHGLSIIYLILVASALAFLWMKSSITKTFIILFIFASFWINKKPLTIVKSLKSDFANYQTNTSIFKTQKSIVDWIYKDASNKGFKVYTYQPAVYDYPYQYLFLWHGQKQYGYLPEEFSYLPNKEEYIQYKKEQLGRNAYKIKPSADFFYLIIEPDIYKNRIDDWLINFPYDKYTLENASNFPDGTIVEKRKFK